MRAENLMKRVVLFLFLITIFSQLTFATASGRAGTTLLSGGSGCSCHGAGTADPIVTATVWGPTTLSPGQTAIYTLVVSGGTGTGGGCNIAADAGTLAPLSSYLKLSGTELVQTATTGYTNGSVTYRFTYKAPATEGSVNLYATGLSSARTESSGIFNFSPDFAITVIAPTVTPGTPILATPANNAIDQSRSPKLIWNKAADAESYHIQIATDAAFTSISKDLTTIDTIVSVSSLGNVTQYYWRVSAVNTLGSGAWSDAWTFTTMNMPEYTAGAFAIIAAQSDTPNKFAIVALDDLIAGSVFTFTDNAWISASGFATTEGTLEWTVTSNIPAGTVVTFNTGTPWTATLGTVSSSGTYPSLSTSGDQIIAFNGTWDVRPTVGTDSRFIWALSLESFVSAASTTTSDCPTALANYSCAMTTSATETDNAYFANALTVQTTVALTDTKANLIALFKDGLNKYYKSNTAVTFPTYTFVVGQISTVPDVPTLVLPATAAVEQPKFGLRFAWNRAASAEKYSIQISESNSFATVIYSDTTLLDSTKIIANAGLVNSTKYYWRVSARNAIGSSNWSNVFEFTTISGSPLSGTKTIGGASPDYPSIRGALADLSVQGIKAPGVTFAIREGDYFEDTLVIQASTSASTPIMIMPESGAAVSINGAGSAVNTSVIKIDNTPYVTIDGGELKTLRIVGIGANALRGVFVTGNSQHTTIKNCYIYSGINTSATAASVEIVSAASNSAPHYSTIDNNFLRNSYNGVLLTGFSASEKLLNVTVSHNLMDSAAVRGVYLTNTAYTQINNNDISLIGGVTAAMYGIYAGSSDYVRIYNNKLHDLNQTSTSSSGTYGIITSISSSVTNGPTTIFNNFVSVSPTNAGTGGIYGIYIQATNNTLSDTVVYNSVNLSGSSPSARTSNAFYRSNATGAAVVVLNNSFQNTRTDVAGSSTTATGRLSLVSAMTSDNNNLYATGGVGRVSTAISATLADWTSANSSDYLSVSENSPTVSANDLHIPNGTLSLLDAHASPLVDFTTDIDGDVRDASTPDIGADEFNGNVTAVGNVKNVIPKDFTLSQNYPNPFNPSTSIAVAIPVESNVRLSIYNTVGQEISVLANNTMSAGYHNIKWNASSYASGMYFYCLDAKSLDGKHSFRQTKKMILVK